MLLSLFSWLPVRYLKILVLMFPKLNSRVVRGCDPVVGEGLPHVLCHPAPRLSAHQVLEMEVMTGEGRHLGVAEDHEVHKALRAEACLVLRRFKVPTKAI